MILFPHPAPLAQGESEGFFGDAIALRSGGQVWSATRELRITLVRISYPDMRKMILEYETPSGRAGG